MNTVTVSPLRAIHESTRLFDRFLGDKSHVERARFVLNLTAFVCLCSLWQHRSVSLCEAPHNFCAFMGHRSRVAGMPA